MRKDLEAVAEVSHSVSWTLLVTSVDTPQLCHQGKSLIVAKCLITSLSFPTIHTQFIVHKNIRGKGEHVERVATEPVN